MKDGWDYKTLGEIAKDSADGPFGSNLKKEHYVSEKEVRIIQLSNIGEEGWREDNKKYTSFEHLKAISRSEVCPGDIVIAKMMPAGRAILCPNIEKKYVLSSDAVKISLKQGYNNKFVLYSINSSYFRRQVYSNVNGSGRVRTSLTKLRKCVLHIPDITTQESIVSYLDSSFKLIDEIKNKALKSLTEAKALFQSALAEAMEPKEGWEEKTLGDVGSFKRGGNFTKRDFIEDGFPCVHYGQIHMKFGHVTKQHLSCVPKGLVKKDRCAKKGDLIIAITSEDDEGSCKCTAWMANYEVYVGGHTAIYTHNLDPIFMAYYFQSPFFQKEKLEYTHGFKVVEINPKDIAKISIAYPPLPTQKQIVSRLDKLSSKVRAIEEKYQKMVDECDALKQAMLRDVFE